MPNAAIEFLVTLSKSTRTRFLERILNTALVVWKVPSEVSDR